MESKLCESYRSDVSKLYERITSLTRAKKSKNACVEDLKNYKEKIIIIESFCNIKKKW